MRYSTGSLPPRGTTHLVRDGAERVRPRAAPAGLRHRSEDVGPPCPAAAPAVAGLGVRRARRRPHDAALVAAGAPPRGDLLVVARQEHGRNLPAAVLRRPGVVRVLGVA